MKVYLTYWCNNEDYEDYNESVEGVFSTHEKAVAAIEAKGYRKGKPPKPFEYLDEEDWHKPWFLHDDGIPRNYHSMWIREMEVDA